MPAAPAAIPSPTSSPLASPSVAARKPTRRRRSRIGAEHASDLLAVRIPPALSYHLARLSAEHRQPVAVLVRAMLSGQPITRTERVGLPPRCDADAVRCLRGHGVLLDQLAKAMNTLARQGYLSPADTEVLYSVSNGVVDLGKEMAAVLARIEAKP